MFHSKDSKAAAIQNKIDEALLELNHENSYTVQDLINLSFAHEKLE